MYKKYLNALNLGSLEIMPMDREKIVKIMFGKYVRGDFGNVY